MRQLFLTAGIVYAITSFAGVATAQTTMPGKVVSNTAGEKLKLIGKDQPDVGKPVGKSVNQIPTNPLLKPYNPANPYEALEGTGLSASSVVAPVNGYSTNVQPTVFQQVNNSLKALFGLNPPPMIQHVYTPGIARRDRERVHERMMIRD